MLIPSFFAKCLVPGGTLVLFFLFLVPLSGRDALLDILVREGVLTEEQARGVEEQARVAVSPNRPVVSEMRIRGRIQPQFGYAVGRNQDGEEGEYATFEMRRVRLGVTGKIGDEYDFGIEANTLPSGFSLQFAYFRWLYADGHRLVAGLERPVFGHEIYTPSSHLLTVERSALSNTFLPSPNISLTGVQAQGTWSGIRYSGGVFNADGGVNQSGQSPAFIYGGSLGFSLPPLADDALKQQIRVDYLGNEREDSSQLFVRHAAALSHELQVGPYLQRSEVIYGETFSGEDIGGFYILPAWSFSERWQVVARYSQMRSSFSRGVAAPNRYLRRIDLPGGVPRGDRLETFYVGINHYLQGHDLKVQLGAEWSDLQDTRSGEGDRLYGVTGYGAIRLLF